MIAKVVPAVRLPTRAGEMYDYRVPENLAPAVVRGAVVIVPFAGRKITGLVVSISERSEHDKPLKEIIGLCQGLSPLPQYIVELWTRLSRIFATTLPRFVWAAMPAVPARAITSVPENNGDRPRYPSKKPDNGSCPRYSFFANSSLDTLKIVREAIASANGRQVLVLVPTVDEVAAWVKTIGNAAAYHSALAAGAKYNLSCAAADGTAKIIVGTKIAAFLPFADLSQIVIVNAGSSSHLQEDQDPRYDARVIAEELSRATDAKLTAIDPLPPLGMTPEGSEDRWRYANQPSALSPVIHDLHDAAKAAKARVLISDALQENIDAQITAGGRVLVILNRRGVSTAYICRECGAIIGCQSCGTALTVHQDRMSCPSCDRLYPLPDSCPKCNGLDIKAVGAGSKTVFEALKKRYPLASVAHVDRDSWQTDLDAAQVVVGTTAVFASMAPAHKQFDLVADALMGAGQMKSGIWAVENSARVLRALSSFVAPNGSLHVQTFDPSAPSLAVLGDPAKFIAKELEERAAFGYPPLKTLITVFGAGDDENETWNQALILAEKIANRIPNSECRKPEWSNPKKFRGKFRLTMAAKFAHSQDPHDLVQYFPTGFSAEAKYL